MAHFFFQTKEAAEEDDEDDDILDEDLPVFERQMSISSVRSYDSYRNSLPRSARRTFSAKSRKEEEDVLVGKKFFVFTYIDVYKFS